MPSKTSTCVTCDDVRAEVVADGFDHAIGPELVDAAGPANQEFADVFERDRVLLPGVVLDDQPPGRRVDDFAPGALRRKLRQPARVADDLVEREPRVLGKRRLVDAERRMRRPARTARFVRRSAVLSASPHLRAFACGHRNDCEKRRVATECHPVTDRHHYQCRARFCRSNRYRLRSRATAGGWRGSMCFLPSINIPGPPARHNVFFFGFLQAIPDRKQAAFRAASVPRADVPCRNVHPAQDRLLARKKPESRSDQIGDRGHFAICREFAIPVDYS